MPDLAAMSRRRWVAVAAAAVAVLLVVGVLAWRWAFTGSPSAGEVRDALAGIVDARCASDPRVEGIDDIGGPGLPEGMWRAHEIVCDADTSNERLAVQYVFRSGGAAETWLSDNDFTAQQRWLVDGRTVVGNVSLSASEWERLRRALD